MRRSGVFVFIAAGLLLVGGAVLWLASGGEADGGKAAVVGELAAGPGDTAPGALPAAWTHDDAPASASLAAVEPEIAAVAVDEVPASYRQALGGLKGRILEHTPDDRETLRPVVGMTVELAGGRASSVLMPRDALLDPAQLEARFLLGSAVTDAEGRFALESIEPRTLGALLLDPGGPRAMFWPLEVTPVSGQASDLGDLVLPETATLVGTVVDEDSQPVAGARVRATDLPLPEAFAGVAEFRQGCGLLFGADMTDGLGDKLVLPPPSLARLESRLPFPTAFTDAEGRFELTGVTPGLVIVVVDDGVHVPLGRSGIATGAAGGRRDVGTLAMSNGLPLAVKVRTSDGQDAPGAEILAGSPLPGAPVGIMKPPRRRAEDGSAHFTGMSDGRAWVGARLDARHDFTVLALPEVAVGEAVITLAVPHTLTLTLLDASGLPVEEGARFFGRALKENQTPDLVLPPIALADRTRGGEKGRWVLSELDPTFWEITTIVPGQPQHRANVDLTAGDAALEVRLPLGHAATVRVVSAADDTPVEWALVQAFPDDDSLDINLFDGPASRRRTDAQGLAQFTALPGGDITFVVDHPGYAVTELEGRLPADDELRVELSAGGAVAGRVIEQGAPPAEPLLVMLHVEDAPGDGELPRFALSDAEGRFRFDRVEPGEVQLEARSRMEVGSMSLFESLFNSPLAEADTTVTEGGTSEVVLEVGANIQDVETGFVSGQLTVNGSAAEGWKIRTWGRIRRSASTDANGRFDLGRIAAGEVELAIAAPSQTMANGYTEQREVQLKAEERLWVPIELTTGAISGHVRSAATGAPLAGVEVSATDAEPEDGWGRRPETISAADGSFTLEPVVAGRYTLRARADGYAQAGSEPFDVAAFQTKTGLVLRLPKALQVSGTISFEGSGEEPDWIWIMATGGGGGDSRDGAQVDPDDLRFTFDNLGPGEWTFELNTSLEVEFETITCTLTADTQSLKLEFKPAPPDPPEAEAAPDGSAPFVYEVK